jgi:hypothetical protein
MSATYKGFNLINPSTVQKPPFGWGTQEYANWQLMVDNVNGDTIAPTTANTTGHQHYSLYDSDSGAQALNCNGDQITVNAQIDTNYPINSEATLSIGGESQLMSAVTVYSGITVQGGLTTDDITTTGNTSLSADAITIDDSGDITINGLQVNLNSSLFGQSASFMNSVDVSSLSVADGPLTIQNIGNYANNSVAVSAGLSVGTLYRNGDVLQIVH